MDGCKRYVENRGAAHRRPRERDVTVSVQMRESNNASQARESDRDISKQLGEPGTLDEADCGLFHSYFESAESPQVYAE